MDKEFKIDTTADEDSTAIDHNDAEENEDLLDVEDELTKQPTVIKKSTGGLSLLLALLALAGVAYLYYLHLQNDAGSVSPAVIQQLQDRDNVLKTDLQNAQVDIGRIQQNTAQIKALEQQINQLKDQLSNTTQSDSDQVSGNQFDNSANETVLAEIKQQLSDQATTIQELQTKSSTDSNTNQTAVPAELMSENFNQIQKNAAIQVLLTTDVLLSTHRLPQAINALDNYLKTSTLKPVDKNHLLRLLSQLQQVNQPDTAAIEQQLQAVKTSVDELQLTTEDQADAELKWYERFISVKKITTETNISSTTELVNFKTELNRLLYQARLYLVLNDQIGWQNSLTAAANWTQQEMPEQQSLSSRFMNLSKQSIVASLPEDLNVNAVINELKGLR